MQRSLIHLCPALLSLTLSIQQKFQLQGFAIRRDGELLVPAPEGALRNEPLRRRSPGWRSSRGHKLIASERDDYSSGYPAISSVSDCRCIEDWIQEQAEYIRDGKYQDWRELPDVKVGAEENFRC
jgi:hypothetical protein